MRFDLGNPGLAQLARLPWELLYDEDKGRFLARGDRRLLIVRSLSVPEFASELGVESPLRVLAAVASPADLPSLNLEEERRRISQSLAGRGGIEIEFLDQANLSSLRERVLASGCQALHFMGHGQFEPKTGEGMIALTGKDGKKQLVPGAILAQHLGDLGLRLVVLNACRTAEVADGSIPDPFAGVAAALVREGLTAAVAMQFPISDSAAIRFSEVFYQRLAAGDPVDVAVSEARLALQTDEPGSLEWATPVLYLRGRANQLVMSPPLLGQARVRLLSWFRPAKGEGWVERLMQLRPWRLPIGRWLVTSLCIGSQALVWFYLGLLAHRAPGLFEGLGAVLTLFALFASLLALRCGLALPPRLGRWTAAFAFLLAASVWLFLDNKFRPS
ncbi:MAG TPA: CHAT domain-containing protein [Thermoanaerobaculia bacterium]|nr:CHAT domain-containing protein [Thermoanaerobaculia bacterium]